MRGEMNTLHNAQAHRGLKVIGALRYLFDGAKWSGYHLETPLLAYLGPVCKRPPCPTIPT